MQLAPEITSSPVTEVRAEGAWLYGLLPHASPSDLIRVDYYGKVFPLRTLQNYTDLLTAYADLGEIADQAAAATASATLINRFGLFDYSAALAEPGSQVPQKLRTAWATHTKQGRIPFVASLEDLLRTARSFSRSLQRLRTARESGHIDWQIASHLAAELNMLLRNEHRPHGNTPDPSLALRTTDRATLELAVTTSTLRGALLLAILQDLEADYKQCANCSRWFKAERIDQLHCSTKCRNRAKVYKTRAIAAVESGKMDVPTAEKHYRVRLDDVTRAGTVTQNKTVKVVGLRRKGRQRDTVQTR